MFTRDKRLALGTLVHLEYKYVIDEDTEVTLAMVIGTWGYKLGSISATTIVHRIGFNPQTCLEYDLQNGYLLLPSGPAGLLTVWWADVDEGLVVPVVNDQHEARC